MADIYTYLSTKGLGAVGGHSLSFNQAGTRAFFVSQEVVANVVRELTFATAWDISTAAFSGNTLSPTTYLHACFLAPDDSNIFICRAQTYGNFEIYQYSLSGGLSTAAYVRTKNFTDAAGTGSNWVHSGSFSSSGLKLILTVNTTIGGLYLTRYNLSTPFDISTAVKAESRYFFTGAFSNPSIFASQTGRRIYGINHVNSNLFRFDLGVEWDLSTATTTDTTSLGPYRLTGIFANEVLERMYILEEPGNGTSNLLEYSFTPAEFEFWTNFSGQTEILE